MKKRIVVLAFVVVLIIAVIGLVAITVGARPVEVFASPEGEREWARESYDSLFNDSLSAFPTLSGISVPSYTIDDSKPNEVNIKWKDTGGDVNLPGYGNRIDAGVGGREVKLPDGQTLTFLAVASHFPGDPTTSSHTSEVTWYDPVDLTPLEDPDSLKLPKQAHVEAGRAQLLLAFTLSDPSIPVRWHFVQARDGRNLARVNGGSSFRDVDGVKVYSLDLDIRHQTSLDLLLSISHGPPKVEVVDLEKNDATSPVKFAGGDAQLAVFFAADGDRNSSGWGGSGDERHHTFRWTKPGSRAHEKSFAVVGVWPPIHSRQMEWRIKSQPNMNWRALHGNDGFDDLTFSSPIAQVKEVEFRYFPEVTHAIFRLAGIPRAPEVENLFTRETGPITFRYRSEIGNFITQSTQTTGLSVYDVWPESAFPKSYENTTAADLLKEAEAIKGEEYHLNPDTFQFGKPPVPLKDRIVEWLKNLF